ncbi:MAG: 30S ribosomal protein S12 methylthiotransferase RimO [Chitinispirillaceae bacterium]|nr:30S ribosomal protein S12 methylthiotransferase RimO [Chitinispirillaceae bacterium]
MQRVALYNLGCSKNIVDGERILHLVKNAGYGRTDDPSRADVIIVNTCAFIREAKEEAIETILSAIQAKGDRPARLIVCGCFSERFRSQAAAQFPEVDLWAGVNDWEALLGGLFGASPDPCERVLSGPRATQYLKIAEGCSHRCSFCVIPAVRGPFKSRSIGSILDEAHWLEGKGVRELILVAQDSSFYGRESGTTLAALLERILAATSIPWIRLMYLHPHFVGREVLRLIAAERRICPYFDIPLQHIAEPLLRSMRRLPLGKGIRELIDRIRSLVPGAALRSTFILGYPGETEAHFRELLRFVEWARFDKLGVFPYSPEEGTAAEKLRPRPRRSTAMRRCEVVMLLQREISREINEGRVGTELDVIIDRVAEDSGYSLEARTRFDAPEVDGKVLIRNGSLRPGSIVPVKIVGASDYDLFAEVAPLRKRETQYRRS